VWHLEIGHNWGCCVGGVNKGQGAGGNRGGHHVDLHLAHMIDVLCVT